MAMQGGLPGDAELIGFDIDEEPKWITVRLQDGSVIQIKMEIVSIARSGMKKEIIPKVKTIKFKITFKSSSNNVNLVDCCVSGRIS